MSTSLHGSRSEFAFSDVFLVHDSGIFVNIFSCVIDLLLTKLAWDLTDRVSALGHVCTDLCTAKTWDRYCPSAVLAREYYQHTYQWPPSAAQTGN